jgi:hypothetical protein
VAIYQDIPTIENGVYTLSYAWRSRTNNDAMEVYWNGTLLDTHSGGTGGWTVETWTVQGAAGSTELRLAEVGTNDSLGTFLDDVQLTRVFDSFDLCAGQYMDVGDVEVWNDGCTLYVRYTTDEPWWMTETHLHVATDPDDIPQTKNGNPKVGHFEYQMIHDPRVNDFTYEVPLNGDGIYYIAAHAVVNDQMEVMNASMMFSSTADPDAGINVYGPASMYMEIDDEAGWGGPNPVVAAWVHPGWTSDVTIPGATWISTAEYVEDAINDSWRLFHDEFMIDASAFNITGTVTATADNAEEVYLNSTFVGNDGPVDDTGYRDTYEWRTEIDYDLTPYLNAGTNELEFIVRNYAQSGGTDQSNPTGLIYEVNINYDYDGSSETAWGDGCEGTSFPGHNWGTYFMFEVVGCDGGD